MPVPPDNRLLEALKKAAARARHYRQTGMGEQNTKASLIDPVLQALGWDTSDLEEVHREYKPKKQDCPVDYCFKLMKKPRLFLEAKGLGQTLADRRWVSQVLGYATVAGVEWCVLSDGDEYRFYNASAPIDADEKMFWRVRLTESADGEAARALSLISRANLEQNLLDVLWVSHFVDRRVRASLRELLAGPVDSIVRLVRQRTPKLTAKEVADSIRRLDIKIEPAAALPEFGERRVAPTKAGKGGVKREGPKLNQVSLKDLIEAGVLKPPVRLNRRHKKGDLEAVIQSDASVEVAGRRYPSLSTAGLAAIRAAGAPMRKSVGGWEFWRLADGAHQGKTLDQVRNGG